MNLEFCVFMKHCFFWHVLRREKESVQPQNLSNLQSIKNKKIKKINLVKVPWEVKVLHVLLKTDGGETRTAWEHSICWREQG